MSNIPEAAPLWMETPLIRSSHISSLLGCAAYLKLEVRCLLQREWTELTKCTWSQNLQPSQSFKYRGLSLFAQECKKKYGKDIHLIIASGGNAALGAACAANVLQIQCTVYITEGANQEMLDFLRQQRAAVVIVGKCYAQTLEQAQEAVKQDKNAYVPAICSEFISNKYVYRVMMPAYDNPTIWQGHASMIKEASYQIPNKPDAIFCSVGGGGLLGGVLVGCKDVGWDDGERKMLLPAPVLVFNLSSAGCCNGNPRIKLFLPFRLCELW